MILWRESYHMTRPLGHCIESAQRRHMCCCARELFFVLHTDKETHKHTRKRRFVCLCIRVLMTSHIQLRTVNLLCILLVILWRSPMAKHDTNKTVYRCLYVHSFMYVCSAQFEEEYTRDCTATTTKWYMMTNSSWHFKNLRKIYDEIMCTKKLFLKEKKMHSVFLFSFVNAQILFSMFNEMRWLFCVRCKCLLWRNFPESNSQVQANW